MKAVLFDVDGTLENEERRAWEKALAEVTLSFDVQVDADVRKPLRENLALLSELYRRTRDSLARPRGGEGPLLAESLGDGPVNGAVGRLAAGDWGPGVALASADRLCPRAERIAVGGGGVVPVGGDAEVVPLRVGLGPGAGGGGGVGVGLAAEDEA